MQKFSFMPPLGGKGIGGESSLALISREAHNHVRTRLWKYVTFCPLTRIPVLVSPGNIDAPARFELCWQRKSHGTSHAGRGRCWCPVGRHFWCCSGICERPSRTRHNGPYCQCVYIAACEGLRSIIAPRFVRPCRRLSVKLKDRPRIELIL
jgi:hypothetical protein